MKLPAKLLNYYLRSNKSNTIQIVKAPHSAVYSEQCKWYSSGILALFRLSRPPKGWQKRKTEKAKDLKITKMNQGNFLFLVGNEKFWHVWNSGCAFDSWIHTEQQIHFLM